MHTAKTPKKNPLYIITCIPVWVREGVDRRKPNKKGVISSRTTSLIYICGSIMYFWYLGRAQKVAALFLLLSHGGWSPCSLQPYTTLSLVYSLQPLYLHSSEGRNLFVPRNIPAQENSLSLSLCLIRHRFLLFYSYCVTQPCPSRLRVSLRLSQLVRRFFFFLSFQDTGASWNIFTIFHDLIFTLWQNDWLIWHLAEEKI